MHIYPGFEEDLKKVERLVFRRPEIRQVLCNIHKLLAIPEYERDHEWLDLLRQWMLVPYSIWPSDFQRFGTHLCSLVASGQAISEQARRILRNFYAVPGPIICAVVLEDEREVQLGDYDQFLTRHALRKYAAAEEELLSDPLVHELVAEFFAKNPTFGAKKVVMRRRLSMERNFRCHGWEYDPTDPRNVTQLEFDSLCYMFQLFGVERLKDGSYKPLLQKLSFNSTGNGISMFIPRYWSFDSQRDVKWGEVTKIQRAWGIKRVGGKWVDGRSLNKKLARLVYAASEEAAERGLTGKERYDHIRKAAGLTADTDPRVLQRLLSLGKQLKEGKRASVKKK